MAVAMAMPMPTGPKAAKAPLIPAPALAVPAAEAPEAAAVG